MGFWGSSVHLFLDGVVGVMGQNALSHGHPLTLHGSLALVTVNETPLDPEVSKTILGDHLSFLLSHWLVDVV